MLTTAQIKNRSKTVTRRRGWSFLKHGDILNACVKCMGLKKGEAIQKLCQIRVIDVRVEQLNVITQEECFKEGFPEKTPEEFVTMFVTHTGGLTCELITRIEFEYVEECANNKMKLTLKGRGETAGHMPSSVAAPLQGSLF